jgi:YD repeat-containing protein
MKKLFLLLLSAVLMLTMLVGTLASCTDEETSNDDGDKGDTTTPDTNETKYNEALAFIGEGKYEEAYAAFKALGDYKDTEKYLARFIYLPSVVDYILYDRSGVMTVTFGDFNLPTRIVSEGTVGVKDGIYTYSDNGLVLKQAVTYEGTLLTYDYIYDANDRLIKAEYREEGVLVSFNDYEYDENGNCVRQGYFMGETAIYNYRNTFDENGNMIRVESEVDGVVYNFTFDENGNRITENSVVPNGTGYNIVYTYDEEGKLIGEVYTQGGEETVANYTYDANGNRTKVEVTFYDGSKETTAWEYDANGNVTKEEFNGADGKYECVETQYALVYCTVDIPEATLNQLDLFFTIR